MDVPNPNAWVGVDLDGTLAFYDHWRGEEHIGVPIPTMVARVKKLLEFGTVVKIFTARATSGANQIKIIEDWCEKHLGVKLPVTNAKDYGMVMLYDDRCVQIEKNTGRVISKSV